MDRDQFKTVSPKSEAQLFRDIDRENERDSGE